VNDKHNIYYSNDSVGLIEMMETAAPNVLASIKKIKYRAVVKVSIDHDGYRIFFIANITSSSLDLEAYLCPEQTSSMGEAYEHAMEHIERIIGKDNYETIHEEICAT
jgi:hypothetical protein